jgi:hypothetical protein
MRRFDELAIREPRLRQVEARAFQYAHEFRNRVPRCRAWLLANGPDGVSIREQLVLLLAHDPQALATAEWHLWEVLPECRGCNCPGPSIAP